MWAKLDVHMCAHSMQALNITNISLAGRGYRYLKDPTLQLYPYGYGLSCVFPWRGLAQPRRTLHPITVQCPVHRELNACLVTGRCNVPAN